MDVSDPRHSLLYSMVMLMTFHSSQSQARKTLPRPHDMMVARDFMTVQVPAGGYAPQNKLSTSNFYIETSIPMHGANNYVDSTTRRATFQDASHGARASSPPPSSSKRVPHPSGNPDSNPSSEPVLNPPVKPVFNPSITSVFNPSWNPVPNPSIQPVSNRPVQPVSNASIERASPDSSPSSNSFLNPSSKPAYKSFRKPDSYLSSKPAFSRKDNSKIEKDSDFTVTHPAHQYISKPRIHREPEESERNVVNPLRIRDQEHNFNSANMDIWDFQYARPVQVPRTGPSRAPSHRSSRPS